MILIADSGSSKTDWRLINGKEISQFSCIGLNPDFVDEAKVAVELAASSPAAVRMRKRKLMYHACTFILISNGMDC